MRVDQAPKVTTTGAWSLGWGSVKAALSSRDDKAVLEECERGEDAAVARYRKVRIPRDGGHDSTLMADSVPA